MNFYIDTEFSEGKTSVMLLSPSKHLIDFISIGIVCENGTSAYLVSKDFDLSKAWNKRDADGSYWIRNNVLNPIFEELLQKEQVARNSNGNTTQVKNAFTQSNMAYLLNVWGETNTAIATKLIEFIDAQRVGDFPVFYGRYCAYDWVVFCGLFGAMMNLPEDYPSCCHDLVTTAIQLNELTGKDTTYRFEKRGYHHALDDAFDCLAFHKFLKSFLE